MSRLALSLNAILLIDSIVLFAYWDRFKMIPPALVGIFQGAELVTLLF